MQTEELIYHLTLINLTDSLVERLHTLFSTLDASSPPTFCEEQKFSRRICNSNLCFFLTLTHSNSL